MAAGGSSLNVQQWMARHSKQPQEAATTMSRPTEVAYWSKTGREAGGEFLFGDLSGLSTYARPRLPADLNEGFGGPGYTSKPEGASSPVDTIVQAASAAGVDWSGVGVATYRNNLNKLLMTPLNDKEGWALHACLHGGTLFLDIVSGPQASYPDAAKFVYYGYKFEALCTGQDHVDATSEFASVVTFRLGGHQVLMAAEVDAQMPSAGDGAGQQQQGQRVYAELKTYSIPRHAKAVANMYRFKHPRWWLQSYLAGIPTLVLGGRDPAGMLQKVQEVPVQALPGMSADAGQPWSPGLLLGFGEAALSFLTQQAAQHPGQQLHCRFDPDSSLIQVDVVPDGDMPQRLQALLPR